VTSANRALVIGVSDYPDPADRLPGVAGDVREIAKLLGSRAGVFDRHGVRVLTDAQVTRSAALAALGDTLGAAAEADTVFAYIAGHGSVWRDAAGATSYFFVPYDGDPNDLPRTAVDLADVKRAFDGCRARNVFLWLDFCHSGGIVARRAGIGTGRAGDEQEVIGRVLRVVRGHGRLIFAACTPEQLAYEDPAGTHGLFTKSLLAGLRGAAAIEGEVTASSLYDYVDRQVGSRRQRPMMFGQMTGRIVLMHHDPGTAAAGGAGATSVKGASKKGRPPVAKAGKWDKSAGPARLVDASGDWCLLADRFYRTRSVRSEKDGRVVVEIPTRSSEEDASVGRLRVGQFGGSPVVGFSHLNDGFEARVEHVESVSTAGQRVWTVTIRPQTTDAGYGFEMSYQSGLRHYSADDIARLWAGRILLNEPPPPGRNANDGYGIGADTTLERLITGSGARGKVLRCIPAAVYTEHQGSRDVAKLARLACVFELKVSRTVEEVLYLALGPVRDNRLRVTFRGRRPAVASNTEATVIELEGECTLS